MSHVVRVNGPTQPPRQRFTRVNLDAFGLWSLLSPLIAVVAALTAGAVLLTLSSVNPLEAYAALAEGAMGGVNSLAVSLAKATPLLLIGVGVAIAFRCGIFNIGAEGQLYAGAIVAAWLGVGLTGLPGILLVSIALLGGIGGGMLWGAVPGYMRARRGLNEVVSTIMLNYVGLYLAGFLVNGPLRERGADYPESPPVGAMLPTLVPNTPLHAGLLLALAAAALAYIIVWHTPFGFEIRAVGLNPEAARHAGIDVERSIVLVMVFSGGLAGLAGAAEVLGVHGRLLESISPGYGYDAIAVALLGRLHPLGIVVSSFFFGALLAGSNQMQRVTGAPAGVVQAIEALAVVFFIAGAALNFGRRRWRLEPASLRGSVERGATAGTES